MCLPKPNKICINVPQLKRSKRGLSAFFWPKEVAETADLGKSTGFTTIRKAEYYFHMTNYLTGCLSIINLSKHNLV